MNKCTIRLLRKTLTDSHDDIIRVYEDPEFYEMYRITFGCGELKKASEFYLDYGRTLEYISNVLKSLSYDTDPFEKVQVETAIHPAVLYHVADMGDREVRHMIEDIVASALRRPVEHVRRS